MTAGTNTPLERPGAAAADFLLGLEAIVGFLLVVSTLLGQMNVAACDGMCSTDAFGVASLIAVLGTVLTFMLSVTAVAVAWIARRGSWWILALGTVMVIACNVIANSITADALRWS